MKVLIACERSGVVRDAFLRRGHDAWSCDLEPCESGGPHIQGDVLDILDEPWDLMVAHPPCTYLAVTGNKWMKEEYRERFPNREQKREEAVAFFMKLANCKIPKYCIENPVGIMSKRWRKPTQIIQPYYFGHREPKKTCLWLRGLPRLNGRLSFALDPSSCEPEYHTTKSGKRLPRWYAYADKSQGQEARAAIRSKTFDGIAEAMARQWG